MVYEAIGERVAEAKVRHLDETGFRIAGKLQRLHGEGRNTGRPLCHEAVNEEPAARRDQRR